MAHPEKLGKYAITGVLGEGAMGVVYRGFDPGIQRQVAIKTIHRSLADSDDAAAVDSMAARFRNEAQAVGRLSHPGIVAIYDYGEDADTRFIAMEFVEGRTLAQILSATPRLPEAQALDITAQLLDALGAAHRAGVWHRDVKPANLILTPEGRVKVTDFGIARIENVALTQVSAAIGTPGYMAPEQYVGEGIDHRVDLFAAGVLLYRMLAGRAPFSGSPETVMYRILNEEPVPPSRVEGSVCPPRFDAVVARALAKAAAQRFQSAAEFRAALEPLAGADDATVIVGRQAAPASPAPIERTTGGMSGRGTGGTLLQASSIAGWEAAALAPVEHALAERLGPMARLLVREAARTCSDLASLVQRVAEHLPEGERAAFLARFAAPGTGGTGGGAALRTGGAGGTAPVGAGTGSNAMTALTPELLKKIERVLTQHIGPIARVVLKKTAQAPTAEALFERLSEQVAAGPERERLLADLRRLV